jgi:hypothetical protein
MIDFPYPAKKDGAKTERHQEIATTIRNRMVEQYRRSSPRDVEVKKFEVTHFPDCPLTFVVVEVGMVGDEGTMASALCRDYRHIVIGKEGGLTLMNARNKRQSKGWFNAIHALTR